MVRIFALYINEVKKVTLVSRRVSVVQIAWRDFAKMQVPLSCCPFRVIEPNSSLRNLKQHCHIISLTWYRCNFSLKRKGK